MKGKSTNSHLCVEEIFNVTKPCNRKLYLRFCWDIVCVCAYVCVHIQKMNEYLK
jgi:hypothetical protein